MSTLSLVLNFAGLLAIAASMDAHRHAFPADAIRRHPIALRLAGAILQAAALVSAIHAQGSALGALLWIIGWAICGIFLTFALALRIRFFM